MGTIGKATMRDIQDVLAEARAQIVISRELCEIAANLRQENAELRELLREALLTNFSSRNHWTDR
ncbi:MAG TPA: hypothetical protein VJ731_03225 [Terriglobales bacterium]|nr:hypothetical protein [Terriglobales bacterium]